VEFCKRRKTALTGDAPFGLTDAFAQDAQKQVRWQGRSRLEALVLNDVIAALVAVMLRVIKVANTNTVF